MNCVFPSLSFWEAQRELVGTKDGIEFHMGMEVGQGRALPHHLPISLLLLLSNGALLGRDGPVALSRGLAASQASHGAGGDI